MRQRLFIALCLLAFLPLPAFSIAGTEGREFWVALTIGRGPNDLEKSDPKDDEFAPKLYVSSKTRTGVVTVTNPQTGFSKSYPIPTGTGWLEISDIPTTEWYPFAASVQGQQSASGKTYKTGLKVTCSEDMSVFAAIRYEYAFDASNILPITALQNEYIVQDYPPYANTEEKKTNAKSTSYSNFCVLATENNTKVEITPAKKTYDGKAAGSTFTVTLNAGDVYYVVSEEGSENNAEAVALSGSYVKSDKPVAVFSGDICTRVPAGKSARDINYEQNMPIDYWGREYIVTRSKEKDANRIRITAQEDDTQINIDGTHFITLNARETHEIELANAAGISGFNLDSKDCFVRDVIYIQTSCPCAVYNYDTGNSYKSSSSELTSGYGDPSMTLMTPLDQNINEITFGVMNTAKTKRHFVNIVTLTENVSSMELHEVVAGQYSNNMFSAADFQPVPAYPAYSYARKQLSIDKNTTYNLKGTKGFIAHVYGNGDDESYAYSVGSAAVKRGVNIDGVTFMDEYVSDRPFCLNDDLSFDAQVGSDIVDKVDWDFGDGVTIQDAKPQIIHTYESPGWYTVTANIYAHKDCPETVYPAEEVTFSFYVNRPDTVWNRFFICDGKSVTFEGKEYTKPMRDTVQVEACDSIVILTIEVGEKSYGRVDTVANDECWYDGTKYTDSGVYEVTLRQPNASGCDSIVTLNLRIRTCLQMELQADTLSVCSGEEFTIPYKRIKGDLGDSYLFIGGQQIPLEVTDGALLCASPLPVGSYEADVIVEDTVCETTLRFPLGVKALYSADIFAQKWGDVLAVLNASYNGGYTFTGFQWYRNGEPIEGATGSWYQAPNGLDRDAQYSVRLTTSDGFTWFSCPKSVSASSSNGDGGITANPGVVPGGGMMQVQASGRGRAAIYSTLGHCESVVTFDDETDLTVPHAAGLYVLQVRMDDGRTRSFQLIVH